jgi:hypothetical protein
VIKPGANLDKASVDLVIVNTAQWTEAEAAEAIVANARRLLAPSGYLLLLATITDALYARIPT